MQNLTPEEEAFVKELSRRGTNNTVPGIIIRTRKGDVAMSNAEEQRMDAICKKAGKTGIELINQCP